MKLKLWTSNCINPKGCKHMWIDIFHIVESNMQLLAIIKRTKMSVSITTNSLVLNATTNCLPFIKIFLTNSHWKGVQLLMLCLMPEEYRYMQSQFCPIVILETHLKFEVSLSCLLYSHIYTVILVSTLIYIQY